MALSLGVSCEPIRTEFLDLAVAKSLQSTRTVTDADDDADDDDADDVLTTTGYTC